MNIKIILLISSVLMSFLNAYLINQKFLFNVKTPELDLNSKGEKTYNLEIIKEVNNINKTVNNICSQDVIVIAKKGKISIRLKGEIYFEKPKNFRFVLSSILGKELDIGSNENVFWYWSKRDKEKGLHYTTHEKIKNSKLKSIFNPIILMDSLGLNEILTNSNQKYNENENHFIIEERIQIESSGENLISQKFIDKKIKRIAGTVLKQEKGISALSKVSYENILPSVVYLEGKLDDISLLLWIKNPKFNINIKENIWQMPNYEPIIDISKD